MPRKYTPTEKADALAHLHQTGNFTLTALQTGISERTLYTWRQQEFLQQTLQQQKPDPPLQKEIPTFADDYDTLAYIRSQIMIELVRLTTNFQDDTAFTTPKQRILTLTQLIDRLIKLDDHLEPYESDEDEDDGPPFLIDHDVQPVDDSDAAEEDQGDDEINFQRFREEELQRSFTQRSILG
jgi:transposase-like protein